MEESNPPTTSHPKRWRRTRRLFLALLILYIAVGVVVYAIQDRLIFPGHASQGLSSSQVRESSDFQLLQLKAADGTLITAIFGHATGGDDLPIAESNSAPTILYFYGNAMSVADSFAEFHRFRRLGCNVLIPDYAGYGMSGGKPSESSLYATADAAYDYLQTRPDIDRKRIIAAGWSLGGAVAIDLAQRKAVAGLITFSAFSSMTNMGRLIFPWLPTSLFIRSKFQSVDKIGRVDAPMLLIHGTHDSIVPVIMQSQLYDAALKTHRAVTIQTVDTDHVDIFESGGDAVNAAIKQFLNALSLAR